jgi:hypothetical protein
VKYALDTNIFIDRILLTRSSADELGLPPESALDWTRRLMSSPAMTCPESAAP